jgi:hypothetical protein
MKNAEIRGMFGSICRIGINIRNTFAKNRELYERRDRVLPKLLQVIFNLNNITKL